MSRQVVVHVELRTLWVDNGDRSWHGEVLVLASNVLGVAESVVSDVPRRSQGIEAHILDYGTVCGIRAGLRSLYVLTPPSRVAVSF